MGYSILLFILGIIKWSTGLDVITYAFLYYLITEDFTSKQLGIFIFFAELFNTSIFGIYILAFTITYLFYRKQRRVLEPNPLFNFIFFSLGYFLIRAIYNLNYFLSCQILIMTFVKHWISDFIFIAILFWVQYWLEKCSLKFIRSS